MKKILVIGATLVALSAGTMMPAAAQPNYSGYGHYDGGNQRYDSGRNDSRADWRDGDRRWEGQDRWTERTRWEQHRRWEERRRWEEQYRWHDRGYDNRTSLYFGF